MSGDRFTPPPAGPPTRVRFPRIERDALANGLEVWSIAHDVAPVIHAALAFRCGTADDPVHRPGLAGLTADLLDEGADGRDAIELAEAMSRLGSHLEVGIGPDLLTLGFTAMTRAFPAALALTAGVAQRPHLALEDFTRIRELRISRLRQLRQSASALGDRAFLAGVFGDHGYGHGAGGTSASLAAMTLDEARAWAADAVVPARAVLLVAGDVSHHEVMAAARSAFGAWAATAPVESLLAAGGRTQPVPPPRPTIRLVDRPGAPQSELRIGHIGPPRRTDAYHALVTVNAALGGQFSSRLNRHLREAKGWTYGVRTLLDFRRDAGTFVCETSVQADATASALADVLEQFRAIRGPRAVGEVELDRARRSLTRGYVRLFETAVNLANAAAQLAAYGLPDDTFDRFVPAVEAVTEADALAAASRFIRPDDCIAVVVGDAAACRDQLAATGLAIEDVAPEM